MAGILNPSKVLQICNRISDYVLQIDSRPDGEHVRKQIQKLVQALKTLNVPDVVLDEKGLPSRVWIERLKEEATKLAESLPPKNGGCGGGGGGVDARSFAAMEEKLQNVQNHIQDVQREFEQIRLELHSTSEEMKKRLSRCATIEHVKTTIKLHDEEIKSFLGQLHKTLPRPRRIEVTKELLGFAKVVHLIFICPDSGFEFAVLSRSWSLWLKFALSLAQTGTLIIEGDLTGAALKGIESVERVYRAYHEKETDQEAFEVILRAPLLLSSEHDQLLDGLREAKYFDSF